jgi:hypothetical protein
MLLPDASSSETNWTRCSRTSKGPRVNGLELLLAIGSSRYKHDDWRKRLHTAIVAMCYRC